MTKLTRKLLFLCILCKVLVFYCPGILSEITTGYPVPVSDFASHRITRPTVYHGREKRQISHTRHTDGHVSDLTVTLELHGKAHIIDLQLKRDLLSQKYFQKHYEGGNEVITRPSVQEADLCHYQGHVRGVKESWVALSTCAGLQGVIYDGRDLHYIQPKNETLDSDHFVYRHSDLTRNYTCGYHNGDISSHLRAVRSAPQGPFKADSRSRYLELVLVADNKEFTTAGGGDLNVMHRRCKDIANIVNALYNPLNIFIALVGVVVWSDRDEINLSRKADETLTNFLTYRRMRLLQDHPNDNAQLLTGTTFEGGIVGKALKGPICTYEYSGGVNMDHSSVVGLVASTVAHEMGHNLGMEHDNESNCQCPHDRCIMAASTSNVSPTQWSTCSLESLAFSFQKGMDFCLRNKPAALFDGPTCGNSFLEEGEECDCGLQAHCKNPCCNPLTCKLHENATCATGECCDLKTCKVRTAGTECRSSAAECDLPEFCTGKSEFCPADLHKMNGLSCGSDKAYCYNGSCRSHSDQCRLLWGPSGKDSELQCYKQNSQGNRTGHCGLNRVTNKYTPCDQADIMCGLLHCSHLNEQLEFGMESVAVLYHSFFNSQGRIIPCRTASVDLGLSDPDPGLVPDGAICGEGKMCVKQKCTAVKDITAGLCPNGCGGNGFCNNMGKCFCNPGYAYPNCDVPGVGGSEDGGPAADPNKSSAFVLGLYIFFLGIVPLLIILFCLWYHCCKNSRNRQQWLRKLTGRGTTKIPLPYVSGDSCMGTWGDNARFKMARWWEALLSLACCIRFRVWLSGARQSSSRVAVEANPRVIDKSSIFHTTHVTPNSDLSGKDDPPLDGSPHSSRPDSGLDSEDEDSSAEPELVGTVRYIGEFAPPASPPRVRNTVQTSDAYGKDESKGAKSKTNKKFVVNDTSTTVTTSPDSDQAVKSKTGRKSPNIDLGCTDVSVQLVNRCEKPKLKTFGVASQRLVTEVISITPMESPELQRHISHSPSPSPSGSPRLHRKKDKSTEPEKRQFSTWLKDHVNLKLPMPGFKHSSLAKTPSTPMSDVSTPQTADTLASFDINLDGDAGNKKALQSSGQSTRPPPLPLHLPPNPRLLPKGPSLAANPKPPLIKVSSTESESGNLSPRGKNPLVKTWSTDSDNTTKAKQPLGKSLSAGSESGRVVSRPVDKPPPPPPAPPSKLKPSSRVKI